MDIYQEIWDSDMKGNGIRPILPEDDRNKAEGYVVVDMNISSPEHCIFQEVHIPERKKLSYQLIEKLFDNYTLNQVHREWNSREKSREIKEFLQMAIDSTPVQIARRFIEEKSNKPFSNREWYSYLYDLWFRQFDWDSGKDLTGFEHVFIGEQKRKKLVGHHFWYKYWFEDNANINNHNLDLIELTRVNNEDQYSCSPNVLTVSYYLKAYDYSKRSYIKILKKRCAFFVGISAEGLLALGTVRAFPHKDVPVTSIINGEKCQLELYMSPDGRSIRTFYPVHVPA